MCECEAVRNRPVMIPVRPLLVGNSPALAAAELGPTDCTNAPDETLRALATWSVDSCKSTRQHVAAPHARTHAHTHKLVVMLCSLTAVLSCCHPVQVGGGAGEEGFSGSGNNWDDKGTASGKGTS